MKLWAQKQKGFTIVELLIVIVVIAILAAISIVAYNGIQERARDSQRVQDVKTIAKALEIYYLDNNTFPSSACTLGTGCKINSSWSTTSDGSWSHLESQLVPKYLSSLPKDPLASTSTNSSIHSGFNYDYVRLVGGTIWCDNSVSRPLYLLSYRLESSAAQERKIIGNCTGLQPTDYASSEYIVVKN